MPHDKSGEEIESWVGAAGKSLVPRRGWAWWRDEIHSSVYDPVFSAIVVMIEVGVFGFNAWAGVGSLVALSGLLILRNKRQATLHLP